MSSKSDHLVVDGSNIATEGRNLPSLKQLDEAVRAMMDERNFSSITVIVDASFAHRIDDSEKAEFETAVDAGEVITPPAGVVGRGDAFILQVADKAKAAVLSNDSFQEFHGEHQWLFDEGRLVGGKPVEHVGWIFVDRVPVRGPASRKAVRDSRSSKPKKGSGRRDSAVSKRRSGSKLAAGPAPTPTKPPPRSRAAKTTANNETAETKSGPRNRRRATDTEAKPRGSSRSKSGRKKAGGGGRSSTSKVDASELNDPATFLSFVSNFSIGDDVSGVVEQFSSHGCYIRASEAQCYLPSNSMGDPPPSRARDIVSQHQSVTVRVTSFDPKRRGINVELVDVGDLIIPTPSSSADTSVEDEQSRSTSHVATKKTAAKRAAKRPAKRKTVKKAAAKRKAPAKRTSARKPAVKKAVAKKAPARKAVTKKAATKKRPAKKTVAKKRPAKKAPARKAVTKKAATKKRPIKKAAKKR